MNKLRIGTRQSLLAKVQANLILNQLEALGLDCELVEIKSEGDVDLTSPLYHMETDSPGVFCKQLEESLLKKEIDIAVHSLKDLPTTQPPELEILAIPEREEVYDCLLIKNTEYDKKYKLGLKAGTLVGTSSLRRSFLRASVTTCPR